MSYLIQQSTTSYPLVFLLVQSSDHVSPLTGASPTVTISKNGGSFASPSGTVTEIANGWYKVAGNATDSNTLGPLILHATATGGDPTDLVYQVVAFNPADGVRLGLAALPNASAGASGGLPALDANLLVDADAKRINAVATTAVTTVSANIGSAQPINFTGTGAGALVKSDMQDIAGSAVSTASAQLGVNVVNWGGAATAGAVPPDALFIRSGTAQGGGASTITLDAGASATNNLYQNAIILIRGGTGAGQAAIIASYAGSTKVATINGAWATSPDATSQFSIVPMGAIAANVAGNVTVGGYAAGQDPASLVLDATDGLEAGLTVRQGLRYSSAALLGALSGAATTTVAIAAAGNPATPRISATVDADGNRSAVTLS